MDIIRKFSDIRSFILRAFATKFHYLIMLGIISGIALTLIIDRPDFAVRGLIYIIPGILIAILLLKSYQKGTKYPDSFFLMQPQRKLFQIIFVSLFSLSVASLYFSSYRPWYYFVLITALFCVIFIQIFSDTHKPSVILFELSCILGNLIFGLQLKYPFYFGLTDIIPHLYYSTITLLSGHIIPLDLDPSYAWFPLYHIFIAQGTMLMGVDVKIAFILLTSLSFIVLVWVLYLFFYQITKNIQTSLLGCLIFASTPIVITYSTYVVTRVMAFIGFVFFLYLAHKQIQTSKWRSFSVLTLLFSLYLILVHQVSILQILLLLFLFALLEILVNDFFAIKTKIAAFIIVTFSTYWLFTSFFFTSIIVQTADSTTIPKLYQMRSQILAGNDIIFLETNIQTAITIFFVILGVGYLCWAYRSKYPSVFGIFVLLMLPVYFPSPITASSMAMVTFRVDRFSLLISPFIAFVLAAGLTFMLYILYNYKYTRKIALVFGLLVFSYLCFSALTGDNAPDSLDFATHEGNSYFTETELNAFNFVPQFIESNYTISSDKYASRMFQKRYFSETKALGLPSFYTASSFGSTDPFIFRDGFFLLRNKEMEDHGLGFESEGADYGEIVKPTQINLGKFSDLTYRSHKLFDNQKVSILSNMI